MPLSSEAPVRLDQKLRNVIFRYARPSARLYRTAKVDTSVGVPIPPTMPPIRMTGIIRGMNASRPVRMISLRFALGVGFQSAKVARTRTVTISIKPITAAGSTPAMNSAPVEIAVAEPRRIRAMLGGTDSAIAADAARIAARSSGA